ncbi:hypothetical protein DENSPDRAFT_659697 [Dentipellis sp. KUC8613]|nr:hypothetical protein DENSPDRAFT_659697 [Dentipellis sp. KUC8613]
MQADLRGCVDSDVRFGSRPLRPRTYVCGLRGCARVGLSFGKLLACVPMRMFAVLAMIQSVYLPEDEPQLSPALCLPSTSYLRHVKSECEPERGCDLDCFDPASRSALINSRSVSIYIRRPRTNQHRFRCRVVCELNKYLSPAGPRRIRNTAGRSRGVPEACRARGGRRTQKALRITHHLRSKLHGLLRLVLCPVPVRFKTRTQHVCLSSCNPWIRKPHR